MQKEIIAIIGGPGTGKSTLINALLAKGFCCYQEISRSITLEARKEGIDQLFLDNPLLFSELLLKGRIEQFESAKKEPDAIVFLDRGIPDVPAYMNYIGTNYPIAFDRECKAHLYSKVFILPPWEEIYVTDDARYENYEQAQQIQNHLIETYQNYGYELIEVPRTTVDKRILFIMDKIYN